MNEAIWGAVGLVAVFLFLVYLQLKKADEKAARHRAKAEQLRKAFSELDLDDDLRNRP